MWTSPAGSGSSPGCALYCLLDCLATNHVINPAMHAVNTEISLNSVDTALIVVFSVFLFCAILRCITV
jgi:hypothetical protein